MKKIAIIGAGAAGLMAACQCADMGMDYILYERNDRVGRKLAITGKGRCNVTNNCTFEEFFQNVPTNPRFLYSSYSSFTSQDTMDYFEGLGVPLKTERGNRVFPVSDRAYDIVDALKSKVKNNIRTVHIGGIAADENGVTGVKIHGKTVPYDAVIVCTGGVSYPKTGSDGDGLRFAEELGLETVPCRPSLVPIESDDPSCAQMQGLSLKNVAIKVVDAENKTVYTDFGEMMFTHFGVTGPMILSASSMIPDISKGTYSLLIDLKPALSEKELDNRLLNDFSKNLNKDFVNSLGALLPSKMIPVFVKKTGISGERKVNSITKKERAGILSTLKAFSLPLSRFRPINEAIVTKGGVSTKEINPKTMESKKIKGLYFCGEVLDVDAYTGGFNLQIAFSTAVSAVRAIFES